MSMKSDVWEFQIATGQFTDYQPPHNFYLGLIEEEFEELKDAVSVNDPIEELDACMDLIYVVLGHCIQRGFDIDGAWAEVQRSNMAKIDPSTGKVKRREDGKILKPADWTSPNLTPFIGNNKGAAL